MPGNCKKEKAMTLKPIERDGLLIRLDEKTESIMRELQSQNAHLDKINGNIKIHDEKITEVRTTIYGGQSDGGLCAKVKSLTSRQTRIIIGITILAASIGGSAAEVIKLFGA